MNRLTCYLYIVLLFAIMNFLTSCGNNINSSKTTSKDTTSITTTWVNPRKGKICENENIVKIPLTAAESQLIGQVKSVTYREFEFAENEGETKSLVDSGCNIYDRAGHLVIQNEYYADKAPKWHCIYKYDNQNKPQEWYLHIYDDDLITTTIFKYDTKGNKIEQTTTDSGKTSMSKITFKYDDRGNELESDMYDNDGKLKQVINYSYDQKGFQVSYTEKDPDGAVFSKLTCAYDANGNKTGGADYSSDTDLENKWVQTNDVLGRRIETDYFLPDGSLIEKRKIRYDDHGFPVEYNTYKKDGKLDEEKSYSFTNDYDKTGNIISQTEVRWKNGKRIPVTYSEYIISYY